MGRKATSSTKKAKTGSDSGSDIEYGIYNVERIVAKKTDPKGKVFYLIKWEGYPSSQNTWESEENVFSEALIKDFENRENSKTAHLDDEFTPSKSPIKTPMSPRRSPLKNQKAEVVSVKTVTRDPDTGELHVHCIMSNNTISVIPSAIANIEFPQIIIKFYESRIKFKDSPSKKVCFNPNDPATMKIAVQGCCHGELHKIYRTLAEMELQQNVKVDLLIVCGDFQAIRDSTDLETMACPPKYRHMGDFRDYYNGTSIAPVPTIFIGGNHEASNFLQELYYGGWVCPNIYYLGHSGVIKFGGLRIAGISGIFYPRDYKTGYYERPPFTYEMIRSAYHYREFEIKKLMKIEEPIDIFLSHEWPTGIYHSGNITELLRRKPYFKNEIASNQLGAKPLEDLMNHLKPKNWYSAHLHVGFDALKEFPDGSKTKFMALDKCVPNREHLRILDIPTPSEIKYPLRIEHDAEWLAILKESEPFINCTRGHWSIPADFHKIKNEFRVEFRSKLSGDDKFVECPKLFDGSEVNQTKLFRHKFLSSVQKDVAQTNNPEEIELEL